MTTLMLTSYVLMWPIIVAAVLFVLVRGFFAEWREARKHGRDLI